MAIAKVLRRPFDFVRPLFEKVLMTGTVEEIPKIDGLDEFHCTWTDLRDKACRAAEEIGAAGELEIMERKRQEGRGLLSLLVCSLTDGRSWYVDISHDHITGWKGAGFDLMTATHIRLKFSACPVTTELLNQSSYLTIASVR